MTLYYTFLLAILLEILFHWWYYKEVIDAGVSELADETDSKSVIRKGVWVRVPPPAPYLISNGLVPMVLGCFYF